MLTVLSALSFVFLLLLLVFVGNSFEKSVKYFDTKGSLIKGYLDGELGLGPLEATAFLVEKRDVRGGPGANFIVVWDADEPVYEPLIEAIMVGFFEGNSISFASPGRALVKRKE